MIGLGKVCGLSRRYEGRGPALRAGGIDTHRDQPLSDLTPDIAPQVLEACTQNAEEAASALGRAFDGEFVLKPGEAATLAADAPPEGLSGGGYALVLKFGESGVLAALGADSGLVPDWVKEPDATGQSKLDTLAQELSMLLVPEDLMAEATPTGWVADFTAALTAGEPAEGAALLPIEVVQGETLGVLHLVWPLGKPDAVFEAASEAVEDAPPAEEAATTGEEAPAAPEAAATEAPEPVGPQSKVLRWVGRAPSDYTDLPANTLSMLQVMVPVSVTLAEKKHKIEDISDMGPGSILTFDKLCDGPIDLEVGGHKVAEGDPVKVGERFGFRVSNMIMPEEHFRPMLPPEAS